MDFLHSNSNKPLFQGQNHVSEVTYKRFKKGIIQKLTRKGPAASTPMATRGQCDPRFDLAEVCQRLDLETQQSHQEPEHKVQQGNSDGIAYFTYLFVLFLSMTQK